MESKNVIQSDSDEEKSIYSKLIQTKQERKKLSVLRTFVLVLSGSIFARRTRLKRSQAPCPAYADLSLRLLPAAYRLQACIAHSFLPTLRASERQLRLPSQSAVRLCTSGGPTTSFGRRRLADRIPWHLSGCGTRNARGERA